MNITVKKGLYALLAIVVTAVVGFFLTWLQVSGLERHDTRQAAALSVTRISSLLDDATRAINAATPLLRQPCSDAVRLTLARMATTQPNVRVISLFRPGQPTCSSYAGMASVTLPPADKAQQHLMLLPDNPLSPGTPVLVLVHARPDGQVTASLHLSDITEYLRFISPRQHLAFVTGGLRLSASGQLTPDTQDGSAYPHLTATGYPFSIAFSDTPLSLTEVIRRGSWLLVATGLLSLLAGWGVWRYAFRPRTPYDNLSHAIQEGEIIPYYQPVFFSDTGALAGVEVLARWDHPQQGMIPPDQFIPLAEDSGLIAALTRRLMQQTLRDLLPCRTHLPDDFHIAFNISPVAPDGDQLVDDCRQFLQAFEKRCGLILEITERVPFTLTPALGSLITRLRQTGARIALDDFGTGYANLQYLNCLAFDFIKIDRAFIARIASADTPAPLVDVVVEMAGRLQLSLVAEGVETRAQRDYLQQKGVAFLQGYYFSPPLSASRFKQQYRLLDAPLAQEP